jgi:sporulation protein YlmC with PRC-barrel domain
MFNFSDLKNCPVLSKKDLCIIGNLKDCVFGENLSQIAYFLCINNEENFLVSPDLLTAVNDALVLEDCTSILKIQDADFTMLKTLIGKDVYSNKGHQVGSVTDLSFDLSGKIGRISLDEDTLNINAISGVGEIILLKAPSKKRRKPSAMNMRSLAKEDKPVSILTAPSQDADNLAQSSAIADSTSPKEANDDIVHDTESKPKLNNTSVTISLTSPNLITASSPVPTRIISDYNFLLGRTLTSALYSFSGAMIAPVGAVVTVDIVDKARLAGKLLELTYNSK